MSRLVFKNQVAYDVFPVQIVREPERDEEISGDDGKMLRMTVISRVLLSQVLLALVKSLSPPRSSFGVSICY